MEVKAERNVRQLDRLVVGWDTLVTFSCSQTQEDESNADSTHESLSDILVKVPYIDGDRSIVVFLHVPKAGGTTLEYILNKNYVINRSIHINAPELEHKPYLLFKHDIVYDVVMGHHKISSILYQLLNRPLIHMTMLRDPVHRVISYYDYLHTYEAHRLHHQVKRMTLQEFSESEEFVELDNAQSRRLVGRLQRQKGQGFQGSDKALSITNSSELLHEAKTILKGRISLFGIVEDYVRFLLMAQQLLRWRDIYYTHQNVSKQKTDVTKVNQATLAVIRQRNQVDLALYNYAKQVFDERCTQLGIDQQRVDQFNTLNGEYQNLVFAHH
ncbi:MAG: hypothetical protein EA367_00565 [Leptolyngbya sp. DLM2.Bin15]|nr:MAG: hypothetical protein EA367_00565 [Leptolyngbya sp. DLM2.Bin15]